MEIRKFIFDVRGKNFRHVKMLGSTMDLGRLSLTTIERSDIAMKIPFDDILDGIRESIYNIESSYNLNNLCVRHTSDSVSVDAWVNEMKSQGSLVRYYKPQSKLCKNYPFLRNDDFCLIIFNEAQLEILKKFGGDCICVDSTHGLNAYVFELVTCLDLDDMRQGFLVSFLLTNRTDSKTIEILFKTIKGCIGAIKPISFYV